MSSSPHAPRQPRYLLMSLLSAALVLGGWLAVSQAQVPTAIRPDGTLGTAVTQSGSVYDITGGTRPGNGPNLFHSFDRFSVGTNDTARFSGPSGIANILSRVTGGQQSSIDGRLQSEMAGANLYLLNPSGVLFGPNASLDVKGSFHVSTADFLRFADGATFSANLSEKTTLTVAPPSAFGFLGPNPAAIAIRGSALQVPVGQALSVVGGEVQVAGGSLVAESGRSLTGGSTVQPTRAGAGPSGGRLHAPGPAGALTGGPSRRLWSRQPGQRWPRRHSPDPEWPLDGRPIADSGEYTGQCTWSEPWARPADHRRCGRYE
jgi:filamentous hemagglutinin family protein